MPEGEQVVERAEDKCCTWKFKLGPIRIRLNPIVTVFSAIIIWGFVIWCVLDPKNSKKYMGEARVWITGTWTWLYIGTQDVWAVLIVILYFSKYANLKLGRDDEKPEFSNASYFTMLFAAGIGIGLFYFGVAEPIWHYAPGHYGNRYWGRYSDNLKAQDAMNVTFFHWGIHGWIVYVVIALVLGIMGYRRGLPMTMRTCFYPLLGDRIFGRLGDLIDTLSVVTTMFGVCTSLGLGVMQLNNGFHRLNPDIKESTENQIISIWVITGVATISVISGMKVGIRRLSEICFGIGTFLLIVVMFMDNTWYILNVYTQSIGYYLQWIIQLGFHTDAFAQINNAPDGKEVANWMDEWTLFYWGWWIAWSPFVGMFIAKISRGRTIKEFINYTMTIPILYTFLWLTVFGGAGLRMERNAEIAGVLCNSTRGGTNSTESWNGLWRLSCRGKNDMWFDLMDSYGDLGTFLSVMSLAGIILYFVTSSDSGSLVIDCLSANGDPDPPIAQRIFWALTEGATATALLVSGGTDALTALQTASLAAGLPYTFIVCFMCVGLWRAVKEEFGEIDHNAPKFSTSLFELLDNPSCKKFVHTLFAIIAPWWPMGYAASRVYNNRSRAWAYMLVLAIPFYGWLILMILQIVNSHLAYVGWAVLFGFFLYGTGIRSGLREKYNIDGNMIEDFFAVMLLYPFAATQMAEHVMNSQLPEIPLTTKSTGNPYENGAGPLDMKSKEAGEPVYDSPDNHNNVHENAYAEDSNHEDTMM